MLRMIRGAVIALALATVPSLVACGGGTSEPSSASPLNGNWVGDYLDHSFQMTLVERDGKVTGTGRYVIGTSVRPVTVTGTATRAGDSVFGDEGELTFSLAVTGEGVPSTKIEGTTSRNIVRGELFEVLTSFVSNAQLGANVYVVFVRP